MREAGGGRAVDRYRVLQAYAAYNDQDVEALLARIRDHKTPATW